MTSTTRIVSVAVLFMLSLAGLAGPLFTRSADLRAAGHEAAVAGESIDPNSASPARMTLLPRIGPVLALRIVEERESNGPFRSASDLARVRGIGPKTVERIAPMLRIVPTQPVAD